MLCSQQGDVRLHVGIGFVALEKLLHPRAGIAEERRVDELDGRGGALDVQQNRFQRDSGT